jgi:phosphoglycerol transferase MdoB-like AlkP superfamily enzyme
VFFNIFEERGYNAEERKERRLSDITCIRSFFLFSLSLLFTLLLPFHRMTFQNAPFATLLVVCVFMLTLAAETSFFMISFHLNDVELQPYQVLDSEVNPSYSTHRHVTVRLYVTAVHRPAERTLLEPKSGRCHFSSQ